jgi:hypothetical protein
MTVLISDWIHTSNDLLLRLMTKHIPAVLNYQIVAQSAEEVQRRRECTGRQHGTILARVWRDKPLEDDQYLQSPG